MDKIKLFKDVANASESEAAELLSDEKGRSFLMKLHNGAIDAIKKVNNFSKANKLKLYQSIGVSYDKFYTVDNTYVSRLTQLRNLIKKLNPDDFAKLIDEGKISRPERTKKKNNVQNEVLNKQQTEAIPYTYKEIQQLAANMIQDLDEKPLAIVLLCELMTGARNSECISLSTFELVKDKKNPEYVKQTGLLKKQSKSKTTSIEKPILPFMSGKTLFDKLAKWRDENDIKVGDLNEKINGPLNAKVNKLLKTYVKDKEKKASTHILRNLYVSSVHFLYGKPNETLAGTIKKVLDHEGLATSLNYLRINILDKCPPCTTKK